VPLFVSSVAVNGNINATTIIGSSNINSRIGNFSTLNVSTFNIGTVGFSNITASNATISNLTTTQNLLVNNQITTQALAVNGSMTVANLGVGTLLTANLISANSLAMTAASSATFPNTATISSFTVSSINGSAYNPSIVGTPTGAVIAYAGASAPGGYLLCDGTSYAQTTYAALYAVIGINYGSTGAGQFSVPDMRTRTVFGASAPAFGNPLGSFILTAIDFGIVQARYPGSSVPNGTNGNGRQALAVLNLQAGYELAKGMNINAVSGGDTGTYQIVDILNYSGNFQGFSPGVPYSWPNFPILILNAARTVSMASDTSFTVTPTVTNKYTMANSYEGNLITQSETQVGYHSHPANGGSGGGVGTSGSANPIQGTNTGLPNNNHYYSIGPSTIGGAVSSFAIACSMPVTPSFVAMNYIIKT
jgi:microcystin-dependent protein